LGTEADLGAQIDAKRPQFAVIDEAGKLNRNRCICTDFAGVRDILGHD
jgi:hypothetical protein